MIEGFFVYAALTLVAWLPAYVTGWIVLRLFGRNVESITTWWSRTIKARHGGAKEKALLKYTVDGREILTAEYAFQVGCLLWVGLLVILPLGVWFLYALLG